MIDTILLDLDDTIYDFKACEKSALKAAFSHYNIRYNDAMISRYSAINDAMWKMLEKGEITREKLRTYRFEKFLKEIGEKIDAAEFTDYYVDRLSESNSLILGARDFIAKLSDKYRVFGVTNGYKKTQEGRLKSSCLGKYFNAIFISEDIGFAKPDKRYFDICIAKISHFDFAKTILIGDSLSSDIAGGINAGIRTIWYNPKGTVNITQYKPDFEVKNYDEILNIVSFL